MQGRDMIRITKVAKTEYHFYQVEDKIPIVHFDTEKRLLFLYNINNEFIPILDFNNFMMKIFLYSSNLPIDNIISEKIPMNEWVEVGDESRIVLDVKQYSNGDIYVAGAVLDQMGIIKYWGIDDKRILEFLKQEWEVQ